eukprot:3605034-Alexandrium_andersonii.AAC.1
MPVKDFVEEISRQNEAVEDSDIASKALDRAKLQNKVAKAVKSALAIANKKMTTTLGAYVKARNAVLAQKGSHEAARAKADGAGV